jgi:3-oxoacyl-(acyl-carrier-protein) synthase
VLVLESAALAERRGARALAAMLGWGQACDGHHIALPQPEGRGLADAMRLALRDAKLAPEDVGYINAHATSTPQGDRAEAVAISSVFGKLRPPVSSTKALTGHALSMSGLLEAALCVLAIEGGFVPGQAHLVDTDCPELNLPQRTADHPLTIAMNNSSGFGGSNVVHIFSATKR